LLLAPEETKRTLIIGAGPFGLAMSAYARAHGIEHAVIGKAMDFWKQQMPEAMLLRSRCNWHLDPLEEHTIEHYLGTRNLRPTDFPDRRFSRDCEP
jgi:FAD-dependent urate hydroxylase